jgi:hypothetical protein
MSTGTIRVFVGVAPDGADAESQAVLEHSLRSRCSLPVEFFWMHLSPDPDSPFYSSVHKYGQQGWDTSTWATPFSGMRWAVPALCGFRGRAIYMDSDTIVLGDMAELWRMEFAASQIVAARSASKFCVSLWDCRAAELHIMPVRGLMARDGHERQAMFFRVRSNLVRALGAEWNYLDTEDTGPFTNVVHYTDISAQPQLNYAIPRLVKAGREHWYDGPIRQGRRDITELWEREFGAARSAGYTVEQYIPDEHFGPCRKRSMARYRARR